MHVNWPTVLSTSATVLVPIGMTVAWVVSRLGARLDRLTEKLDDARQRMARLEGRLNGDSGANP